MGGGDTTEGDTGGGYRLWLCLVVGGNWGHWAGGRWCPHCPRAVSPVPPWVSPSRGSGRRGPCAPHPPCGLFFLFLLLGGAGGWQGWGDSAVTSCHLPVPLPCHRSWSGLAPPQCPQTLQQPPGPQCPHVPPTATTVPISPMSPLPPASPHPVCPSLTGTVPAGGTVSPVSPSPLTGAVPAGGTVSPVSPLCPHPRSPGLSPPCPRCPRRVSGCAASACCRMSPRCSEGRGQAHRRQRRRCPPASRSSSSSARSHPRSESPAGPRDTATAPGDTLVALGDGGWRRAGDEGPAGRGQSGVGDTLGTLWGGIGTLGTPWGQAKGQAGDLGLPLWSWEEKPQGGAGLMGWVWSGCGLS